MVELLITQNFLQEVLYDVLLYAISERNIGLVRTIYNVIIGNTQAGVSGITPGANSPNANQNLLLAPQNFIDIHKQFENSKFHEHITPLLLAAQIGCYELIEYFAGQGYQVPNPHSRVCQCDICR
jgi:hypothetical protein